MGILQVLTFDFLKFRISEILKFHPYILHIHGIQHLLNDPILKKPFLSKYPVEGAVRPSNLRSACAQVDLCFTWAHEGTFDPWLPKERPAKTDQTLRMIYIGVAQITQVTHVRYKNSNIQGRSPK